MAVDHGLDWRVRLVRQESHFAASTMPRLLRVLFHLLRTGMLRTGMLRTGML